jgi:hypothetical protein
MKLDAQALSKNAIQIAVGAVIVIAAVYYLGRKTIKDVASGAAGVVTGDNAITQNQTNASGEKVTAYEGAGVLGTLGAVFNSASGGSFASLGQWLGDKTFSIFHPSRDRDMLTYLVIFPDGSKHAVNGTDVDDDGYFSYSGRRYRLGINQANQNVAIAA